MTIYEGHRHTKKSVRPNNNYSNRQSEYCQKTKNYNYLKIMSKTDHESECPVINHVTESLKLLTINKHKKNIKVPSVRPPKLQVSTKKKPEPIWDAFEPEESEREEEIDGTKENTSLQFITNDSDDEDIEITPKGISDLSTNATEILLEADQQGLSQTQVIISLQRLKQRIISNPRMHSLQEAFCRQTTDFGVTFTALEYAAYKNKREVVAFLVDVITNDCFPNVLEAGQYFGSLQLLHGMVMSSQRRANTLDLLLSVTVVHNGKDWLLFSPWAKNEEGKTMMDLLRENTDMAEGSRRCLEDELRGRMDALRGANIFGICDAEVDLDNGDVILDENIPHNGDIILDDNIPHNDDIPNNENIPHNDDIPLLPELGHFISVEEQNGDHGEANDVNGDLSPESISLDTNLQNTQ